VVNISKEAAELYCHWLSDLWNSQQEEYILTFRLPTKQEWEYAATGQANNESQVYPWKGTDCKDKNGVYLAQHKAFGMIFGPSPTASFKPNGFGLYNMCGNVAEMISDQEFAKGGSWNDSENNIKITSQQPLKASPFIGFRPVMTYVKK
jgi:formylglycine-generating enzyme required for sulfatase activity